MGGRNSILLSLETLPWWSSTNHIFFNDLLPWIHQNYFDELSSLSTKTSNLLFFLSSPHFWHLNPVLDCKILRESKGKSVYKNKQSTCIGMTSWAFKDRKLNPFPVWSFLKPPNSHAVYFVSLKRPDSTSQMISLFLHPVSEGFLLNK